MPFLFIKHKYKTNLQDDTNLKTATFACTIPSNGTGFSNPWPHFVLSKNKKQIPPDEIKRIFGMSSV